LYPNESKTKVYIAFEENTKGKKEQGLVIFLSRVLYHDSMLAPLICCGKNSIVQQLR